MRSLSLAKRLSQLAIRYSPTSAATRCRALPLIVRAVASIPQPAINAPADFHLDNPMFCFQVSF